LPAGRQWKRGMSNLYAIGESEIGKTGEQDQRTWILKVPGFPESSAIS